MGAGTESGSGTKSPPLGVDGETTATPRARGRAALPAPRERAPPSSRRPGQGPAGGGERRPRVAGSLPAGVLAQLWALALRPGPPRCRPPLRSQRNLGKRGFQSFSKESWEKNKTKQKTRKQKTNGKTPSPALLRPSNTGRRGLCRPPGKRAGRGEAPRPGRRLLSCAARARRAAPGSAPLLAPAGPLGLGGSLAAPRPPAARTVLLRLSSGKQVSVYLYFYYPEYDADGPSLGAQLFRCHLLVLGQPRHPAVLVRALPLVGGVLRQRHVDL